MSLRRLCCREIIEPKIDFDYPKIESKAYTTKETKDTFWGKYVSTRTPSSSDSDSDNQSGFHPMADGVDALASRLVLARKAEKCIDAQYYLIKYDVVGQIFLHTLLQAADRGVRVRLLIDDMFTTGYDKGLVALCSHPNFEIRIFNPMQRNDITDKSIDANLTDFDRINRRMHNKSFTVDNQVTILGGRNIADEYFGLNTKSQFHDDDVLAIGPVVQDVSNSFDRYWNHSLSLPAPAFCRPLPYNANPKEELDAIREDCADTVRDDFASTKYGEATRAKANDYLTTTTDDDLFSWAPYQFVADSPNKGIPSKALDASLIGTPLLKSIAKVQKRLVVVSPYFVPIQDEIQAYANMVKRGIEVIIITNSLAANNMFMVHGGYAPCRIPLLKAGVKIYEARADAPVLGSEHIRAKTKKAKAKAKGAVTTLHTKEFFVDDKELFIGSFNFDPRSINLNTECGVIIQDSQLTSKMAKEYLDCLDTFAFEVYLSSSNDNEKDQDQQLRWRTIMNDGKPKVFRKEPQTSLLQRCLGSLARIAPKSQL